jgi:dihydroorotase
LAEGAPGDVTVIDPAREWTYDVNKSQSKSRNSPFHGSKFKGCAVTTIVGGKVVYVS